MVNKSCARNEIPGVIHSNAPVGQLESLIEQALQDHSTNLDLSYMGLRELSPDIGRLTDLVDLDLRGNILDSLPDEISNLHRLTGIHLDGNNLRKFPPVLGKLTRLERLGLSDNRLANLPRELGSLKELGSVNIHSNQFDSLPAALWKLTKLVHLDASENRIERITGGIGALKNLRYLNLARNHISEVPANLGSLKELRHLNLHGNSVATLPTRLFRLPALTHLDISNNDFDEIQKDLANLTSLNWLDASGQTSFPDVPPEIRDLIEAGVAFCDGLDTAEVPIAFLQWALQFRQDALSASDGQNQAGIKSLVQSTVDLVRFWVAGSDPVSQRFTLGDQEYNRTGPGHAGYILWFEGGVLGQKLSEFGDVGGGLNDFPLEGYSEPYARILVPNDDCVFDYGFDLAQMWMSYGFDGITVCRADGKILSDSNLQHIQQQIASDIYQDFDEEDDDELRLEFTVSEGKEYLVVSFYKL
jgi:Leucine-rich repeat (LRR) protein